MRGYECYVYHMRNGKLILNNSTECWAALKRIPDVRVKIKENCIIVKLNKEESEYIYIDQYIQPQITDAQRKRIISLVNKIVPCKLVKIEGKVYIKYKLLKNHYSNLLLLNFIRILWYPNQSFNNKQFFIDISKPKPRKLDYLEFMMTCIKDNVDPNNTFRYGNHSFVYSNIIPKKKEDLLIYKGESMESFLKMRTII